ncbi:MAG: hypothetical protein JNM56_30335 [Planctomycetia bacterium]|nr:hypothetical protein [Planctomycetia bacterium]
MSQSYRATITPLDPDDGVVLIDSGHNFSGVGPTVALEGGYRLGNSGFALIGSTRGSLLFGSGRQSAEGRSTFDGDAFALSASQENNDLLPVWDLELGGEYSRDVGNFNFFFQAAFVAQVWFGAGNAANNDIITGLFDPEVSDKNADLGLYGLRLTGGFRY